MLVGISSINGKPDFSLYKKSFSPLKVLYASKTLETVSIRTNKCYLGDRCKIPSGGAKIGSVTLAGALRLITFGTSVQTATNAI